MCQSLVIGEYTDTETGTNPNRTHYQLMLRDARSGKFSHLAAENAERFGRDDAEALRAIDELDRLGIQVRFADYPDLNPTDADERIMISLNFTLARRESKKLSERVKGGIYAKLRNGGYAGRPPDGYVNRQAATQGIEKSILGRVH
ncbi:MAG: recombinase family protein [Anaerolineae bacterium]|nr:recombinase family protein [Anaerolineae bacterium]